MLDTPIDIRFYLAAGSSLSADIPVWGQDPGMSKSKRRQASVQRPNTRSPRSRPQNPNAGDRSTGMRMVTRWLGQPPSAPHPPGRDLESRAPPRPRSRAHPPARSKRKGSNPGSHQPRRSEGKQALVSPRVRAPVALFPTHLDREPSRERASCPDQLEQGRANSNRHAIEQEFDLSAGGSFRRPG